VARGGPAKITSKFWQIFWAAENSLLFSPASLATENHLLFAPANSQPPKLI
jgi:hypothetical protein